MGTVQQSRESGHSHSHGSTSTRRLAWTLGVTVVILVVEVVGVFISGSLALLADAGHMLVDSSGLVIALIASHLVLRPRSTSRTWGYVRAEVVAAALQALFLLVICITILWEAIGRLSDPVEVASTPMLIIGVVGLLGNLVSLFILAGGRDSSLNMRAAFLEVATDALGSVAVIVAAIVLITTGWPYADSVASVLIAAMIVPRSYKLLRDSVHILMENAPEGLDMEEVEAHLLKHPQVAEVHDLHANTVGTGLVTVTAHVVLKPEMANLSGAEQAELLQEIQSCIKDHFPGQINHLTVQIDPPGNDCDEVLAH